METTPKQENGQIIARNMFGNRQWVTNSNLEHPKGRVWIVGHLRYYEIEVQHMTEQLMHYKASIFTLYMDITRKLREGDFGRILHT